MSYQTKLDLSDSINQNYPNAIELNPPSATTSYNCHAYAWHLTETGGPPVWIGYYLDEDPLIVEDIYWEDASYIRVSSESEATKISYYEDNHSAIQTGTQGTYISKWGAWPLVQHARDYGPAVYQMDYRYYYAVPEISGPSKVCYPSGGTFSVQDFVGVTYSWTKSNNLTFTSGTTSRTVTVRPNSSTTAGEGWIQVAITVTAYDETHTVSPMEFYVGVPPHPSLDPEPPIYMEIDDPLEIEVDDIGIAGPITDYDWSIVWGTSIDWLSDPDDPVFEAEGYEEGWTVFEVRISNSCGQSVKHGGFINVWDDGESGSKGGLLIHPNPASTKIIVTFDEEKLDEPIEDFIATLASAKKPSLFRVIDMFGEVKLTQLYYGTLETTIDVTELKEGVYYLQLILEEEIFQSIFMISRK